MVDERDRRRLAGILVGTGVIHLERATVRSRNDVVATRRNLVVVGRRSRVDEVAHQAAGRCVRRVDLDTGWPLVGAVNRVKRPLVCYDLAHLDGRAG